MNFERDFSLIFKGLLLIPLVASLLSWSAVADAGVVARAKITSKYVYRGLIQSASHPALQAGLDYNFRKGRYVGAWASMVQGGQQRNLEMNYYYGRMIQAGSVILDYGIQNYDFHHLSANKARTDLFLNAYLGKWGANFYYDLKDVETVYMRFRRVFYLPEDMRMTVAVGKQLYEAADSAVTPQSSTSYTDYLIRTEREMVKGLYVGVDYTGITGRIETKAYFSLFIELDLE